MRWFGPLLPILCLGFCLDAAAATGRVKKVLPHFLDKEGRHTVSPSLYDRDAYQKTLRDHPERRSGIRFDVHWNTKGAAYDRLTLRLEIRGTAEGALPKQLWIDTPVASGGKLFGKWTGIKLSEADYRHVGEVTAWRVTLWEGSQLLAEQKSFLW